MLLDIHHATTYRYAQPATYSMQYVRLFPRTDGGQRILSWQIESPGRRWRQADAYGNQTYAMSLVEPHEEIRIVAHGQVETSDERGLLLPHDSQVPPLAFALPTALTEADAAIQAMAAKALGTTGSTAGNATSEALQQLMRAVASSLRYVKGSTNVSVTAGEALAQGAGVCQDMAHVFLAACRARGVPARYVSGYLLTDEKQHTASHAWAEAWIADANRGNGAWQGFDINNQRLAGPELCRLAVGRDYMDASPVRGMRFGGVDEKMFVTVAVAGK